MWCSSNARRKSLSESPRWQTLARRAIESRMIQIPM
jgi:hypothetical protein